jgi:hypothetical protein
MTENRLFAGWLRLLTGLVAVAGVLALSACGGGSGAPNNPFKGVVTVVPSAVTVYAGVPTLLTISRWNRAIQAFSSNPGRPSRRAERIGKEHPAPREQPSTPDTTVTITVQDLGPLSPVPARRRWSSPCARRPSSIH